MALTGYKVVEFAGLAPGPFAGLVLADNGASVIRVDKPGSSSTDILSRGKRSLAISPKDETGLATLKSIIASADVLIDPFRPGVLERLGLGPEVFLGDNGLNPKLVYARIVGFPRTGPHKDMAGHDINYLALSGVLSMLPGSKEKPSFPINILADFAGGGLMCATGIILALLERVKTGRGQVVDANMVSGVRYLSSFVLLHALVGNMSPLFGGDRGTNVLDGGAPFYDIYVCKGGGLMSVGCIEPQFFRVFIETLVKSLPNDFSVQGGWVPTFESQADRTQWLNLRDYITQAFLTNDRDYWEKEFHGTDACAVPVLTSQEAINLSSAPVPIPHPISRPVVAPSLLEPGEHTAEILKEAGLSSEEIRALEKKGVVVVKAKL